MRAAELAAVAAAAALAGCDDLVIGENLDAEVVPPARFAIAYLDHEEVREDDVAWRVNPTIGLVINVRDDGQPIELADLQVQSVDDDSPRVELSITIVGPTYALPAGTAGGRLASGGDWIAPLVPEPRFDDAAPSLQYRLDYLDPPPHRFDATVHATVVITLGDHAVTLPFVVDIRSSGPVGGGPRGARRIRSLRIDP